MHSIIEYLTYQHFSNNNTCFFSNGHFKFRKSRIQSSLNDINKTYLDLGNVLPNKSDNYLKSWCEYFMYYHVSVLNYCEI